MRQSKTLHELLGPVDSSPFASLSHSQKLELRQLQEVFTRDMPSSIKVLVLVKELPFKEAYNSLSKYAERPAAPPQARAKLGQQTYKNE